MFQSAEEFARFCEWLDMQGKRFDRGEIDEATYLYLIQFELDLYGAAIIGVDEE